MPAIKTAKKTVRKTPIERVENFARQLHGPHTKVVVYRDPEIDVWVVDLMSGKRFIRSTSTSGSKAKTVNDVLRDLKEEVRVSRCCPNCGTRVRSIRKGL